LVASPAALSFGAVPVGSEQTLRIAWSNRSVDPLLVVLRAGGGFTLSERALAIDAGAERAIDVTFTPRVGGAIEDALIALPISGGDPVAVPLSASGS
jgi:hypothetical protein